MKLSILTAVAKNGSVGKNGEIPWHFPEDEERFLNLTIGNPVIMCLEMHRVIGRILPNRLNIIVTAQDLDLSNQGSVVVHSFAEALAHAKIVWPGETFCIGGAEIYKMAMPFSDKIYLTRIEKDYDGDAFFPPIDMEVWRCIYTKCAGWQKDGNDRFLAYFLEFDKSKLENPAS